MIVHLGVVSLAIGLIASSSYLSQASYSLQAGETVQFGDSSVTYMSADRISFPNRIQERVMIDIDGDILTPSVERFTASGQLVPSPATKTSVKEDIQVALLNPPEGEKNSIVIQITKQPMLIWIWLGGVIMLTGTLLSAVNTQRVGKTRKRPELSTRAREGAEQ
tara:strand:- start:664 stop:1155 length:492 start_codon:yes stop_codon:yes gene_type:complete